MMNGSTAPEGITDNTASKLDDLAREAASVEADSTGGFMKPGQQVKRGRGRPKKEPGAQGTTGGTSHQAPGAGGLSGTTVDNTETYKQILSPVWQTVSQVAVQITQEPQAGMTTNEHALITQSSAACVQQYVPDALGRHANLVLLMASLGTWSGRVYLLYLAKKEEIEIQKKKNKEREVNGQAGHPSPVM